ncbi:MAG: M1 family aminopeptidase [Bacteroidota bacterium]
MKKILLLICFYCFLSSVWSQNDVPSVNLRVDGHKQLTSNNNFTRSLLMSDYDVKFYFLDINLERTSTAISGIVRIDAQVKTARLDTFVFELIDNLTVDSVYINNTKCTYTRNNNHTYVKVLPALFQNALFTTKIYYGGAPASGGFFSGISNATSQTWQNQVTWTLSEPFNASQWWPCKQDLTDKADSAWVFITTDATNKAGSNGLLTNITTMPNGKKRFEWKTKTKIEYYLISASVAKYVDYSFYVQFPGRTDSTLIQNYIYDNPQTLTNFKTEIDKTEDFILLYSDLMGLYPFHKEKYGHCMAPLSGGMEHQTMTTLGFFEFYLTSHELSHQWFGDNVTCATWQDIWINEGWASYCEYFAAQYLDSYAEAQSHMLDVHNNVLAEPGGSIYIPISDIGDEMRIFDSRLSYNKGSAVIHNMRFEVGDDTVFFDIIKDFQQIYKDSVATIDDFKTVMEAHSGKNFTDFYNQWMYGEGYPTYNVVWNYSNDTLRFTTNQTTSSTVTPLFKMKMEYKLLSPQGDTVITVYQTANNNTYEIYIPRTITNIQVDPNNWVLNKVGTIAVGNPEELNAELITVYPNPCNNKLTLNLRADIEATIFICDITGRSIMNKQVNNAQSSIDVSTLNSGMYLIKIRTNRGEVIKKFVKD